MKRNTGIKGALSYAWREGTVYIILVALIIFFSIIGRPFFFTWANFKNIISESSFYIIAGMGIAFVMIGGGIDLSVGYEMAMVSTTSFSFFPFLKVTTPPTPM